MTPPLTDTPYAGHQFRTRLEARWAVFFDTLQVRWQYEPQAFDLAPLPDNTLHLGTYLPTFWLPAQKAWFAVTRDEPADEGWQRFFRFAELLDQRAFLAVGELPDPRTIEESGHPYEGDFEIHTMGDHHYAWTICRWCDFADLAFDARSARTLCGCHRTKYPDSLAPCCNGDKCCRGDLPEILAAYSTARSARFEGDRPNL
ncbi:hypothetical protein ACFV2E_07615 [Streptomyces globisporus]|uniref:hypothetical protein n=1 Tax=Streptomyces globisporus TaxID=1908 RepID=UPI003674FC91